MTNRIALSGDLSVSRLAYGMWRTSEDADTSPGHIQAKIEACLMQGITTIDQADIYGDYGAEALLGACLRSSPQLRAKIEIVTKCGIVAPVGRYGDKRVKYYDTSAKHIAASVDQSLRAMAIDQIDLLLIHRPDPFMDHHETGAALDRLIAAGKVGCVGVSNFRPHDASLLQSAMENPIATNQIELSLLAHSAFTNGDLAYLQERAIVPMAWSPLGGGAILGAANKKLSAVLDGIAARTGTDSAAVAIAWLLAHPARIIPVLGSNRLDRIARFSDALQVELDRQSWFELYSAALGRPVA